MGLEALGFLEIAPPVSGTTACVPSGAAGVCAAGDPSTTGAGVAPQACKTGSNTRMLRIRMERNRFITLSFHTTQAETLKVFPVNQDVESTEKIKFEMWLRLHKRPLGFD
jgi:hypothetical protein